MIVNASCFEARGIDFDVMFADPPYSAHVHANAVSQSEKRGARKRDLGFDHLSDELRTHVAMLAAGVRRWSVICSDVEGLADWRTACTTCGATYVRPIPWVRWSMPQLSGDRPPSGCEFATVFYGTTKGKKSWNGPGNLTHLAHKCLRGEGKHRAEKPLDQALDLVSWFSEPGERVLDPCTGSGTVGLACKLLGRDYVGYELDPKWAAHAHDRIERGWNLSARDRERYERWLQSVEARKTATPYLAKKAG